MSLSFSAQVSASDRGGLAALYGDEAYAELFEKSYAKRLAYEDGRLVGAVRVISEGVETALLVDLATVWDKDSTGVEQNAAGTPSKKVEVSKALLSELEKDLSGRRVMAYGRRKDLESFEAAGYGRCKNAWIFFREGMDGREFLPSGYRYESEFIDELAAKAEAGQESGNSVRPERKQVTVDYRDGLGEASFEEVNQVLTDAFWGRPHDVNKTEKAFTNSRYSVSAYDAGKLIGVARSVADGSRYATILNVAVNPEYQGLSIGKNLLRRLMGIIKEDIIVLNTHPGAVGFYNRLPELRRTKYIFEKFVADPSDERRSGQKPEFRVKMFTPAGYRFPDEY